MCIRDRYSTSAPSLDDAPVECWADPVPSKPTPAQRQQSPTPLQRKRPEPSASLEQTLLKAVNNKPSRLKAAFKSFDSCGSGTVTPADFKQALRNLNLNLSAPEIARLIAKTGSISNGNIDYHKITSVFQTCLLYTSDAADEEDSVDLGGRRFIKKKKEIRRIKLHKT
eukprot:TRINITY_DN11971_c0_g1_i1.p1 TRINITY_DN11971_c0_g1~~TRINITY_DN11971_c0_g1_i1.p1  ORF type:complete len:178 (+),score=44.28 TRINITY_DN11971_c0_g1_i1:33-536(+)